MLASSSDTGTVWKWVDESNINYALFPPPYEFAAWPQLYGEGPHCLIIQPWTSSARNPWDATRCAYRNYFMCKLPKSAVVSTYTGPEGCCQQRLLRSAVQCCAVQLFGFFIASHELLIHIHHNNLDKKCWSVCLQCEDIVIHIVAMDGKR